MPNDIIPKSQAVTKPDIQSIIASPIYPIYLGEKPSPVNLIE